VSAFTWYLEKDPFDQVDKTFEFGPNPENRGWLKTGETVTAGTVTAPAGITATGTTNSTTAVTTRISGGTAGQSYDLAVRVTTSTGQQVEMTARVYVRDR